MKKVVHLMICGGVQKMSLKYLLDLEEYFWKFKLFVGCRNISIEYMR